MPGRSAVEGEPINNPQGLAVDDYRWEIGAVVPLNQLSEHCLLEDEVANDP